MRQKLISFNKIGKKVATIVATALLAAPAFAGAALELPPRPLGPIADIAEVINETDEAVLDAELRAYYEQTGNSVVVATVPTLQGETGASYAVKLFEEWGIGDAKKDTGVLLLIAPFGEVGEREVRIEVGYGLEGDLTDAESTWIVDRTLIPAFKSGDISGGALAGAREIIKAIGDVSYAPASEGVVSLSGDMWEFLIWIVIMFLVGFSATKRKWDGPLFGGIAGALIGFFVFNLTAAAFFTFIGVVLGLLFEFGRSNNHKGGFWSGLGGGRSGGSFGGFGGGSSGGGGGGGRW